MKSSLVNLIVKKLIICFILIILIKRKSYSKTIIYRSSIIKFTIMSTIKIELRKEDVDFIIKEICASFNNDPQELINVLHTCQEHFGYLPAEVQEVISDELNMPVAKIYGVVTFYSFFTMTPKGKHPISICIGTACYVSGAKKCLMSSKRSLGTGWRDLPKTINSPYQA